MQKKFRLFRSEVLGKPGSRIGLQPNALARLTVLRRLCEQLQREINELGLEENYRSASMQELRTREWVFSEETGKIHECQLIVSDCCYVSLKNPAQPHSPLLIYFSADANDHEDIEATVLKSESGYSIVTNAEAR